ncbi:MAG: hypothetical protein LAP21_14600 [Acidobacteriia bacterium]|nr:hypothetical protein [Terriglobia bacterium]
MHSPVKSHRPEDAELSKKIEELTGLQSRLAELEFRMFNLRLELTEFESLYSAKVGPVYAELDEVEALIAEKIAKAKPHDDKAAEAAGTARRRADESRKAAMDALATPAQPTRSDSLRDLYRLAAKRLHPDLSRDDDDRKIRERLMTEANLAYANGDEAKLRAILEEYDSSPDAVVGTDVASELVRVIRRISLVNKRILQIETEIAEVKTSELFRLKTLVEDGTRTGKDVLGDMVERLKQQIQARRQHLRSL